MSTDLIVFLKNGKKLMFDYVVSVKRDLKDNTLNFVYTDNSSTKTRTVTLLLKNVAGYAVSQ